MNPVSRRRPATLLLMSLLSALFALSAVLGNPHGAAAARGPLGITLSSDTLALSPTNQTATVTPGQVYSYDYVITNNSAKPQQFRVDVKNPAGWSVLVASQAKQVPAFGTTHVKIAVTVPTYLPATVGSNVITIGVSNFSTPATGAPTSYLTLQWGKPVLTSR